MAFHIQESRKGNDLTFKFEIDSKLCYSGQFNFENKSGFFDFHDMHFEINNGLKFSKYYFDGLNLFENGIKIIEQVPNGLKFNGKDYHIVDGEVDEYMVHFSEKVDDKEIRITTSELDVGRWEMERQVKIIFPDFKFVKNKSEDGEITTEIYYFWEYGYLFHVDYQNKNFNYDLRLPNAKYSIRSMFCTRYDPK